MGRPQESFGAAFKNNVEKKTGDRRKNYLELTYKLSKTDKQTVLLLERVRKGIKNTLTTLGLGK